MTPSTLPATIVLFRNMLRRDGKRGTNESADQIKVSAIPCSMGTQPSVDHECKSSASPSPSPPPPSHPTERDDKKPTCPSDKPSSPDPTAPAPSPDQPKPSAPDPDPPPLAAWVSNGCATTSSRARAHCAANHRHVSLSIVVPIKAKKFPFSKESNVCYLRKGIP